LALTKTGVAEPDLQGSVSFSLLGHGFGFFSSKIQGFVAMTSQDLKKIIILQ
jgi:hypothetical protein